MRRVVLSFQKRLVPRRVFREVCPCTLIWFEVKSELFDCYRGRFDALFVNNDMVLAFIRSLLRCSPIHQSVLCVEKLSPIAEAAALILLYASSSSQVFVLHEGELTVIWMSSTYEIISSLVGFKHE